MQLDEQHADAVALRLAQIALEAGRLLQRMERAITDHRVKPDGTPTTGADLAAENLIIERLKEAWSDIPVVAEETANAASPDHCFFLVDPLDGTSDFIRGTGEYSVNIAAIKGTRPIASVVSAPAVGRIWIAGMTAQSGRIAGEKVDSIAWETAKVRPAPERDRRPRGAAGTATARPNRACPLARHRNATDGLFGPQILPDRQRRGRH